MNNWKLRKAFTGNNTSDVQTINGYIAAGEDNDFSVEVSPVGKEYPAPLVVLRTNLVLQSNQFDTTWVNVGSTLTGGQAGYDGSSNAWLLDSPNTGYSRIEQNPTYTGIFTFSIYAKAGTANYMSFENGGIVGDSIYFDLQQGRVNVFSSGAIDATITKVGESGWYRCSVTLSGTSNNQRVYASTSGTDVNSGVAGNIYIQDAQLEAGDKATEYIPTTTEAVTRSWDSFSRVENQVPGICNGTHTHTGAASASGIAATTLTGTGSGGKFKYEFDTLGKLTLIEAMTHENLLLQSNQFDTTWATFSASVTSGQSGYDGTNNAWLLTATSTYNRVQQDISVSGAKRFSVYAKANTNDYLLLGSFEGAHRYATFNLATGAVDSNNVNAISPSIEDVGGGWYRCSATWINTTTIVRIGTQDASGQSGWAPTTSGSIYIQDAQLEEGTQATGYIETTTAPVREGAGQGYRVDDKLSITTNEGHDIEFRLVEGSNATTVTVGMEATKPSKPVPFPVTKMRVADSTDRQVLIMDQRSRYVFPKPTPYLLDSYEGAAAAYSLRRLRSAYTGPAVRVRRESNNDELDIYFDGQGNLDTASLEAFCAGTNGFVKVWYDQSGNGNDATQEAATADQPKIVSSGSIIPEGGKPAIEFDGTDDHLDFASSITIKALFCVTSPVQSINDDLILSDGVGGGSGNHFGFNDGLYLREYPDYSPGYPHGLSANEQNLVSATILSGNKIYYVNSASVGSSSGMALPSYNTIGIPSGVQNFEGNAQEIVIYESDESSNRTGIETNINDYYNIY